jgi:hypothetical protein
MSQPSLNTEAPGQIEIDNPDRSGSTGACNEPLGEHRYVIWFAVHLGHVPVNCWCDRWKGSGTIN